jgi:hypothetical protein
MTTLTTDSVQAGHVIMDGPFKHHVVGSFTKQFAVANHLWLQNRSFREGKFWTVFVCPTCGLSLQNPHDVEQRFTVNFDIEVFQILNNKTIKVDYTQREKPLGYACYHEKCREAWVKEQTPFFAPPKTK